MRIFGSIGLMVASLSWGGASLPEGKLRASDRTLKKAPELKMGDPGYCFSYDAYPHGGDVYYADWDQSLWVLSKIGHGKTQSKTHPSHAVYKVDIEKKIARKVMAMNVKGDVTMIPEGNPIEGMTLLSFAGKQDGCYHGLGAGVTFSFLNFQAGLEAPKASRSLPKSNYKVFTTDLGRRAGDMRYGSIKSVDYRSFQVRGGLAYDKDSIPLYANHSSRMIYLWNPKSGGLLEKMSVGGRRVERRMKIKPGYKLVQSGEKFAVAGFDQRNSEIVLREVPQWTGGAEQTYKVKLPVGTRVGDTRLAAHFGRKRLLVIGGGIESRKIWRRIFVFDYAQGKKVSDYRLPTGTYAAHGGLDVSGEHAYVVLKDQNDFEAGIRVFNFADRKWYRVTEIKPSSKKKPG